MVIRHASVFYYFTMYYFILFLLGINVTYYTQISIFIYLNHPNLKLLHDITKHTRACGL